MDYRLLLIRFAIIFSLVSFAWLIIAGTPFDVAIIRSFFAFIVLLAGLRVIIPAIGLITDNSHRKETGDQELEKNEPI